MKTQAEVMAALKLPWSGEIETRDGFSYLPWNRVLEAMIEVFDVDGFSIESLSTNMERVSNEDCVSTYGYSARVRVTVYTKDGVPMIREGVGFNELLFTKSGKALIDTSIKGAASNGINRAMVLFGPAFGLSLYSRDASDAAAPARPAQQNTDRKLSDAQKNFLAKLHYPPAVIETISYAAAKEAMDTKTNYAAPKAAKAPVTVPENNEWEF